ncbi:MAG: hypothetical protein E6R04_08650 [Spirochaetes bacterium]|nr:MAG: hypothetical protein E6R04_08650 [Spirochaetota bacterium]
MNNPRVTVDDTMMISAVRYALGRMSYIVSWTVDETIRVWDGMSKNSREVIERDVRRAKADGVVGMPIDGEQWDRLLNFIDAHNEKASRVETHQRVIHEMEEDRKSRCR